MNLYSNILRYAIFVIQHFISHKVLENFNNLPSFSLKQFFHLRCTLTWSNLYYNKGICQPPPLLPFKERGYLHTMLVHLISPPPHEHCSSYLWWFLWTNLSKNVGILILVQFVTLLNSKDRFSIIAMNYQFVEKVHSIPQWNWFSTSTNQFFSV